MFGECQQLEWDHWLSSAAPIAPDNNLGSQRSRLMPREPVLNSCRSGWQDHTIVSEAKQGSGTRSWERGEAPELFIGTGLGKDLSAEKHKVHGLCMGLGQSCDGDNEVMLVLCMLQEQRSPLFWHGGMALGMPRVSVLRHGLGK